MNDFGRFGDFQRAKAIDIREDVPYQNEIKEPKRMKLWHKIVAGVLLFSVIICLVYGLLDPFAKLKIKLWAFDNFTLEVVGSYGSQFDSEYIYVDGDLLQIGSEYYELDDGRIYKYWQNHRGVWERELLEDRKGVQEAYELGADLLDKDNYEREEGKLSTWALNKETERKISGLTNITFGRDAGKLAIVGYRYSIRVSMRFTRFGTTEIDPPWEE